MGVSMEDTSTLVWYLRAMMEPKQYSTLFDRKYYIVEQVIQIKSSLLLIIVLLNMQTLQLLTKIIKTENIYKSN